MNSIAFAGAAAVIAAAAFVAPGVGRAEDVQPPAAETSSVCFNPGLYAKGAVVDYDTKITGDGATGTYRNVNTAKATVKYNGVDAIPVETQSYDAKGKPADLVTGYYEIEPAFLLLFGTKSKSAETTYKPEGRQPIDQKTGKAYKQKYTMTTKAQGATQTINRQATWKFEGFETLKLPLGTFKLCRITAKFVDQIGPFSTVTNQTVYTAAEGKYQGFALRTKTSTQLITGQPMNTQSDVVKFKKFAPK